MKKILIPLISSAAVISIIFVFAPLLTNAKTTVNTATQNACIKIYNEAIKTANKTYSQAVKFANSVYSAALKKNNKTYKSDIAKATTNYKTSLASAKTKDAKTSVLKTYKDAKSSALKTLNNANAIAKKIKQDALASVLKALNNSKKLATDAKTTCLKQASVKKPAKIVPYCVNNVCEHPENRETCPQDCMYTPMEDEDIISEDNVIIIYNKKFDKEWEKLQLKDNLNCLSILRDRFKIELSEPAKTKLLILDKLVGDDKRAYSSANPFGIINFWHSPPTNIDYFRKKIEEEGVCLNSHEMTHVFVLQTPIPWWADEGLATYAEKEFGKYSAEIECRESGWYGPSYYGGEGDIEQPYSDLSKPPGEGGEPGAYWYYTGYCFWKYIQEKYGESAIAKILQELKKNENNHSLDFLKDIVNKVLNEDITKITKVKFGIPSE